MIQMSGRGIAELLFRVIVLFMGAVTFLMAVHDWEAGRFRSALWECGAGFSALWIANITELSDKVSWREALRNRQRWKLTPVGTVCQFFAFSSFLLWAVSGLA